MTDEMITQKRLKELLNYNHETGIFTWRVSRQGIRINAVAGTLSKGYIRIKINYRFYSAHRLAFLYMTGNWPVDQVDHDKHIRNDNRWVNLNQASPATNNKNSSMSDKNTSGHVGVYWNKGNNKWLSQIGVNGKRKHLGYFVDIEDAKAARKSAEIKYGYHENHGMC